MMGWGAEHFVSGRDEFNGRKEAQEAQKKTPYFCDFCDLLWPLRFGHFRLGLRRVGKSSG
jgi:hypothetical protein